MESKYGRFEEKCLNLIRKHEGKTCEYLFMGDSWVEYWTRPEKMKSDVTFEKDAARFNINAINVGVGGTAYSDWVKWTDDLVVPYRPSKIFISLGDNDLFYGQTVDEVYGNFLRLITDIQNALSGVKIYVSSNCHTPRYQHNLEKEEMLSALINSYAQKTKNVIYLPLDIEFDKTGKKREEFFVEDMLHLNRMGYEVWGVKAMEIMTDKSN